MAAINLRGANTSPWQYTHVFSGGDVWQEFTLPEWCRVLTIHPEGVVGYVAGRGAGTPGSPTIPVDGAAVGADRIHIPADAALEWKRGLLQNDPMIFIASGAAGSVTLHMEP